MNYTRPHVKRAAKKIAAAVHAREMNEVAVPLVMRDTIIEGTGMSAMYHPWLHTAGMKYYKAELKRLRAQPN